MNNVSFVMNLNSIHGFVTCETGIITVSMPKQYGYNNNWIGSIAND